MDLLANNHTLCQVGPPNNLTPSTVLLLLLLLLMMGMVIHLQLLAVMVSRFLGMVRPVDSRRHLVMLRLVVMVSTLPHNLDMVNKQLQTQVMVTKEAWIRVMVVVKGWGMVQRHLFSQLIPNQHQHQLRFRFSLGMISRFLKVAGDM